MKKKFTFLGAALVLLAFLAIPLGMKGQTGESYSATYSYSDLGDMLYGSYLDASSYWKVPATAGNDAVISIPITYQPESNITITFQIATFGTGTNPSSSNTTISAVGTESDSNWSGSGINTYPSSSSYVNGVMTITKPEDPTTLGGLDITMSVDSGVKIFRLKTVTIAYTYGSAAETYTVTYDCNGGTSGCPENLTEIEAGTPIQLASAPSKTDYDFAGWSDGTDTYDAGDPYTVNSDVTFTAQWTEECQWVLTNLADLTPNDVFVIVGDGYAMTNNNGSQDAPAIVAVTIANNEITSTVAAKIQWTVSGDATNGYSFSPNGSTNTWLYCNTNAENSSNNNIRVGSGGQYNRILFELNSNNILMTKDDYATRYLSLYTPNGASTPQDWRGYLNTNLSPAISFYKRITGDVLPPSISADNISIEYNATSGAIAYTVNNGVNDGTISAAVTDGDWLTLGQGTSSPISFTCTANQAATARTATVTLTYTYGTRATATANITVTQSANPNAVDNISDITNTDTPYAVRGTIVAKSARSLVFGDGTGYVYYYNANLDPSAYNLGDIKRVSGTMGSYNHVFQFTSSATIEAATESNYNNTPAIQVLDASGIGAYNSDLHLSDYVQIQGLLSTNTSGNNTYYNITIENLATTASIAYPTSEQISTLTALVDKTIIVKGYFAGVSSGHFNVVMESAEEVTDPTITVNPATVNAPAGGKSGTLEVTYEHISEIVANVYFCDDQGNPDTYDWIEAEMNDDDNLDYTISANSGAARTAYMKVNVGTTYSNLVTITQDAFVLDYATLPFEFDGGRADIATTAGLTQEGLDTDYNSSPKLKFKEAGTYVILHFNETPGKLTFDIKGNSFSGGTFTVQTSEDGENYTDLETYTELGAKQQTESFNNLDENVRYIKWIYTQKVNGNVALGNIKLLQPAVMYDLTIESFENLEMFVFVGEQSEMVLDSAGTIQVAEGDTVMLSISALEGYEIESLMVDGNEHVNDIDDSMMYLFEMPSHNVTISATAVALAPPTGDEYALYTEALVEGDYVIYYNGVAMKDEVNNNRLSYESISPNSDDVIITDNAALVWHIAPNGDYWTIYSADAEKFAAGTAKNKAGLIDTVSDIARWTVSLDDSTYEFENYGRSLSSDPNNKYLRYNDGYGFACYSSSTGGALSLYKKVENANSTQTIELAEGWNWISTYIEMEGVDGLAMLQESLNGNAEQIKQGVYFTEYDAEWDEWFDSGLTEMSNELMYLVKTITACEVSLEGTVANLSNHSITINPGWNWIGFPSDQSMTVEDAFANFTPESGDKIQYGVTFNEYDAEWDMWFDNGLTQLVPGRGYLYYYNGTTPQTLNFGSAK